MSDLVMESASPSAPVSRRDESIRRYFRMGWGLIGLVFGGLILWSVFAPFEGAVLTSGQITVESNQQAVQHLEGGIVREIYVREGDSVREGEALISLDSTAIDATLASVEARLFELLGTEARLLAERDGLDVMQVRAGFETVIGKPEFQAILAAQNELLRARADNRKTQLSILNQRIAQLRQRISGLRQGIESTERQIRAINEELGIWEALGAKGLGNEPRLLALRREQAALEGSKNAQSNEIATIRVQIGEARSEIAALQQGFHEEVLTDLRAVQTQIEELNEERTASLDRKQRLTIRAPRSGSVIGVTAHTIGGVITPSQPIMYIVPENDALVAKLQVMLADIDKISIGQTATLRFSAFNMNTTPEVKGTVEKISADALTNEMTGMPYYEVIVRYPDDALPSDRFTVLPGMPVEALVRTENRSVLSYLIKPLTDSMSKTFREE